MKETKFTPGPWKHQKDGNMANCVEGQSGRRLYDHDDGFRTVAVVQSCCEDGTRAIEDANCQANIDLIAAAPDLYEALETLLSCSALADENHSDPEWGDPDTAMAIDHARQALSRARGESGSDSR